MSDPLTRKQAKRYIALLAKRRDAQATFALQAEGRGFAAAEAQALDWAITNLRHLAGSRSKFAAQSAPTPAVQGLTEREQFESWDFFQRMNPAAQEYAWRGWQAAVRNHSPSMEARPRIPFKRFHLNAENGLMTEAERGGWIRYVDHVAALSAPEQAARTPSSHWHANGEPDPHDSDYYDQQRAQLCMGDLTDDELANGAFLNYDRHPSAAEMVAGKPTPAVWMTAVKDRIRWLSRALEKALAAQQADARDAALNDEQVDALLSEWADAAGLLPDFIDDIRSDLRQLVRATPDWTANRLAEARAAMAASKKEG